MTEPEELIMLINMDEIEETDSYCESIEKKLKRYLDEHKSLNPNNLEDWEDDELENLYDDLDEDF